MKTGFDFPPAAELQYETVSEDVVVMRNDYSMQRQYQSSHGHRSVFLKRELENMDPSFK